MSKSSTGAGSGMDRKVQNRQRLLIRCYHELIRLFRQDPRNAAQNDLMRDLGCYIKNPPKMRVRPKIECRRFDIWNAAVAKFGTGDDRGAAIRTAIESGETVQVPLRDLAAMRDKIGELTSLCRNLDLEFEE